MRRTRIVLTIVVLAVLLAATPGLVAAKGGQGGTTFNIYGTIVALNSVERTIDVLVEFPASLAGDITVETNGDTRFKECEDGVSVRIDFEDLEVGWKVRTSGVVDGGSYVAIRVIQYVP